MKSINLEQEKEIIDTEELKEEYQRIIRKFNTLAKQYTKIKSLTDITNQKYEDMQIEYRNIRTENIKLKQENKGLKNYIHKSIEWVSVVLNWSFERVNKLINDYIERKEENEQDYKYRTHRR